MSTTIGKDKNGHPWIVEIDDTGEPTSKGKPVLFWVFSAYTAPKRRSHARAQALTFIESDYVAKLEFIAVDERIRRKKIGSLLLNFVEGWMVEHEILRMHGDISDTYGEYGNSFHTLQEYLEAVRSFYTKHGWTFRLFTNDDLQPTENIHFIGRVKRRLR